MQVLMLKLGDLRAVNAAKDTIYMDRRSRCTTPPAEKRACRKIISAT